ncbi:hypothetical protein CGRA01v4_14703 [Colletotrichum graminicola]|nr:hypothetical protein CGRA01v4_14703 [Colletotrichum graminicola]
MRVNGSGEIHAIIQGPLKIERPSCNGLLALTGLSRLILDHRPLVCPWNPSFSLSFDNQQSVWQCPAPVPEPSVPAAPFIPFSLTHSLRLSALTLVIHVRLSVCLSVCTASHFHASTYSRTAYVHRPQRHRTRRIVSSFACGQPRHQASNATQITTFSVHASPGCRFPSPTCSPNLLAKALPAGFLSATASTCTLRSADHHLSKLRHWFTNSTSTTGYMRKQYGAASYQLCVFPTRHKLDTLDRVP